MKKCIKELIENKNASFIPIAIYIGAVLIVGAFYTLLFIVFAIPVLSPFVPDSIYKTFILGLVWFMPCFILCVLTIAVIQEGLQRNPNWRVTK